MKRGMAGLYKIRVRDQAGRRRRPLYPLRPDLGLGLARDQDRLGRSAAVPRGGPPVLAGRGGVVFPDRAAAQEARARLRRLDRGLVVRPVELLLRLRDDL